MFKTSQLVLVGIRMLEGIWADCSFWRFFKCLWMNFLDTFSTFQKNQMSRLCNMLKRWRNMVRIKNTW